MSRRHPPSLAAIVAALGLSCSTPAGTPSDPAAIQLAAAAEVVGSIARNPGSVTTICVGYAGNWEPPRLPSLDGPTPTLAAMDGCEERDGRLISRDAGGQAISVSVRAPEARGDLRAAVSVFTSTGSVDLAAYTCTVRHVDGAWRSQGCELDAIS